MIRIEQTPVVSVVERDVPTLSSPLHCNAVVHRVLAARGITEPSDLLCSASDLPRPDSLSHIDVAIDRLITARDRSEKVLIVGDYDCDGATSTTVAMQGLSMLGFQHLGYLIPNRFENGYGLSPEIVDIAHQTTQASLIVTVDNGVASVEGVERATQLGIDVIVTDHHLPPTQLPKAAAIVNPNLDGSHFPSPNLAGVGVIFYTLLALRSALTANNDAYAKAPLADLLDLVAIGTVADVVPLDRTNRILVEQGLRRIRAGRTRPGIYALLDEAKRQYQTISTQDIGFGIGPRLNAAGRLDDMRVGVQCLMASDTKCAKELASTLNDLNQARRSIEKEMRNTADEQLSLLNLDEMSEAVTFSICLINQDWHQGVIGILAGRIKESLQRPVIVFTSDDELHLKGSGRSISGVHIRDVLQEIAVEQPHMITKFGGHAMAAGLTLRKACCKQFKALFEQKVQAALGGELPFREFLSDGALSAGERTLVNAQLLATIMPWGQGFGAPLFSGYFEVISHRILGGAHLKLSLKSCEDVHGSGEDAIAFNCTMEPQARQPVFAVYSLEVNTWQNRDSVQLRVHHIEQAALR